MLNILKPAGDKNFPYWPGLGIQNISAIPGDQIAGEISDIPINRSMHMLGYSVQDIDKVSTPEALQDRRGATELLETPPPLGRGAGTGLTDMLLMSVAKQQAQGSTDE
jgi:hypothetical protein